MSKARIILGVLLILSAVAIAFYPAWTGQAGYVWDDDMHVAENASLRSVKGLKAIWSWGPKLLVDSKTPAATPQYYPVTFTTFWVESQFWSTSNALGFHITNVLLHAGSAILLWACLYRLKFGEGVAIGAALLFAVHPVTAESVVWVSERKNSLALFFMLAASLSYIRWARLDEGMPAEGARSKLGYAGFVAFFVLALLSKSVTSMVLPSLVILTWYRHGKVTRKDWWGLAPLFVAALGMGLLTSHIERTVVGANGPDWQISFVQSFLIAGQAIGFYVGKLLVPVNLAFIYPRWEIDPANAVLWIAPVVVLGVVIGLFAMRRRIGRGPVTAAILFIVLLFPALGFFKYFPMRYSFVADHFQYFAAIVFITFVAVLTAKVIHRLSAGNVKIARVMAACVLVPVAAVLSYQTFQQARAYKDADTLWRDTVAKNKQCWMAYENLAKSARAGGNAAGLERAEELYKKTLQIKPNHVQGYHSLGTLYIEMGRGDEADEMLKQGLTLVEMVREEYPEAKEPRFLEALIHSSMASQLISKNEPEKARVMLEEVVQTIPNDTTAWNNLGNALQAMKKFPEAIDAYQKAIDVDAKNAAAYNNMGVVLFSQGKYGDAMRRFEQALKHNKNYADAWSNLGRVYRLNQQNLNAIVAFQRSISCNPRQPATYFNLGEALMAVHKDADAANAFGSALLLNPKFAAAAAALAEVRSMSIEAGVRNPQQGIELAQLAVELTEEKDITYMEILAQAYAEAKQFENAVDVMQRAMYKASVQGYPSEQIEAMELRFRKYAAMRATSVERSTGEPAATQP